MADDEDNKILPNEKKGLTKHLVFSFIACVIGTSFQFGFHTGVVNAPQEVIENFLNDTNVKRTGSPMAESTITLLWSFIVSIFAVGGMCGGISAGYFINKFGRKYTMLLNNIPLITGCLLLFFSKYVMSYEMLLAGRFVIGVGSGIATGVAPVYLSEVAPVSLRGAAGTLNQFNIVIGVLLSEILGLDKLLGTEDRWPFLFGVSFLAALSQLLLLSFCPESPRHLLLNGGKTEEAEKALSWLRNQPVSEIQDEIEEMEEERISQSDIPKVSLGDFFRHQWLLQPLILSVVLQLSQQLSGINAVIYYSTSIFESAGISHTMAQYGTIILGVVNLVMTFISAILMDRAGRRTLFLTGLGGMWVFTCFMTVSFLWKEQWSFMSYISILSAMGFIVSFATGPGSIPWFIVAEVFSQGPRGIAMSIAVLVNWFANFCVGLIYPILQKTIKDYSFLPFVCLIAIFWIFSYFKLPETKGKTIEEITSGFRDKSHIQDKNAGAYQTLDGTDTE